MRIFDRLSLLSAAVDGFLVLIEMAFLLSGGFAFYNYNVLQGAM